MLLFVSVSHQVVRESGYLETGEGVLGKQQNICNAIVLCILRFHQSGSSRKGLEMYTVLISVLISNELDIVHCIRHPHGLKVPYQFIMYIPRNSWLK